MKTGNFSALVGQTITAIEGCEVGSDYIQLTLASGGQARMWHQTDCCESVSLEQIDGDVNDLIGKPVLLASTSASDDDPSRAPHDESWTWTFYTLATVKGYVTLRWYGTSNGYYSEQADFEMQLPDEPENVA